MVDPYLYPGTETLINRLNLRDPAKLQDTEALIFYVKSQKPTPAGQFNYDHLKAIHKHFFSDLYHWAGQERTIDIIKSHSHFARKEYIAKELNKLFSTLQQENYLQGLDKATFCQKLAHYFNEINAAHPFREGNGRTLRAFSDQLASQAGYSLSWKNVDCDEYINANILGFNGDNSAMEAVLQKITSQLDRARQIEISAEKNLYFLRRYVEQQIQLAELLRRENIYLSVEPAIAKDYVEQAAILSKDIAKTTEHLKNLDVDVRKLLTNQETTVQKRGGFEAIYQRMLKNDIKTEDIVAILHHAQESLHISRGNYGEYK